MNKCKNCSKFVTKRNNVYCDKECYTEYQFKQSLEKFKEGKVKDNKTLKKILVYLEGEKCKVCSQGNTWNNLPLSLQVDHKDGNSDNNMPENVRLVCPNCHSLTSTYKSLNKKGRGKRTCIASHS